MTATAEEMLAATYTWCAEQDGELPVVVSLFAGIGGIDVGFMLNGFETVALVEWDKDCQRVLRERFPNAVIFSDVTEVDADELKRIVGGRRVILTGGFPCQDLSVAGGRAGLAGERSGLYRELLRIADALDPDWLLLENVPGLLSADIDPDANDGAGWGAGTAMGLLLGDVTGYRPAVPDVGWRSSGMCVGPRRSVSWRVLDARHFGVAQRRRRVFLVACPRDRAAPAAVLLELEGLRGDPPSGEPPRPLSSARTGASALRAGGAAADGGGAEGADPGVDVVSTLQAAGGDRGWRLDAEGAAGGHIVPSTGADGGKVAHALLTGGDKQDETSMTYVLGEEDPARPVTVRGREGGAQAEMGTEPLMNALRAGDGSSSRQQTILDPARPVGRRGRDGGTMPELGDEPLMNALGTAGGGSSMPTVLAYEVDKERGVPNDEGVKVTETDVAPPLLADGDPAERTDRGLRIIDTYAPDQAATLTAGTARDGVNPSGRRREDDTNLVATPVQGLRGDAAQNGAGVGEPGDPAYTLDTTGSQAVAVGEPQALAFNQRDEARLGDQAYSLQTQPGADEQLVYVPGEDDAAIPIELRNASRSGGTGVGTPGTGVGHDGDPMGTLGTLPLSAVATFRKQRRAADPTDDETWVEDDRANTLNTFDGGDARATEVVVEIPPRPAYVDETPPGYREPVYPDDWTDDLCPECGCSVDHHDAGGFCAGGACGGNLCHGRQFIHEAAPTPFHVTQDPISGGDVTPAMDGGGPRGSGTIGTEQAGTVRRLSPRECERLQGYPDDWTLMPKTATAKEASDSARYRELGNSVAVPVLSWIAWRVAAYERGWRPAA